MLSETDWASRRARYWDATHALRQAEQLAQMAASVSGPADVAPATPAAERGFIRDWSARAKQALKKAWAWQMEKSRAMQRRGKEIARRVHEGARRIAALNPSEAVASGIMDLAKRSGQMAGLSFVLGSGGALLALFVIYEVFFKGK